MGRLPLAELAAAHRGLGPAWALGKQFVADDVRVEIIDEDCCGRSPPNS